MSMTVVGGIDWALNAPPSGEVAVVLGSIDPHTLSGYQRVELIQAWERHASWVAANQQVALASVVEATTALGLPGHQARHEVGAALRLAPGTAYDRCQRAQELTGRLTDTLSALRAGEISSYQACMVTDAVVGLGDEIAAALERRVLRRAPQQTSAQTKQLIRRALLSLNPAGCAERAAQAAERTITKQPLDDGMTEIRAVLRATDAERVWQELTNRAQTERTRLRAADLANPGIDALRADALVAAILDQAPAEVTESDIDTNSRPRKSAPVQVRVTIDAATLLGLADNPAELQGYGPIPAQLARELAGDSEWVRWTTDPQTGQLLDINTRTYRPSPKLAAFVRAAHPTCAWKGCRQPSARCDLDHTVNYPTGPPIRPNLGPFCRQHHNAKTHGRWHYRRDPDNTGHLRSPLGHRYDIPPPAPPTLS